MKTVLLGLLLGSTVTVAASDGGWILWEVTKYLGDDGAKLAREGYSDRWSAVDGYDTAADCHAAAKVKAETSDKVTNEHTATIKPVAFIVINRCFPVAFDPSTMVP